MNILGWENWTVTQGQQKGTDYKLEAEYELRPTVCPKCGVESPKLESCGIRRVQVQDDLIHGRRVRIAVRKRQWKCHECEKTFVEKPLEIDEKRRVTKRLLVTLQRKSFERPFVEVADEYGVSEGTIRNIFDEELKRREKEWEVKPPRVLGIDEVHLDAKRFVAANLGSKPAALIEMLEDRNKETVERFLENAPWRHHVEVVVMDMWAPYRTAVANGLSEDVTIVVDRFHVVRIANRIIDRFRDSLARSASGADRKALKKSRGIARRRRHDLDEDGLKTVEQWRETLPELYEAYEVKEALHTIYDASDRGEGDERISAWIESMPARLRGVFKEQITALVGWKREILNYFDVNKVTNAGTERLNRFIRVTRELGNGYSFEVLRGKMLYGAPRVVPKFWEGDGEVMRIPGSLGYSMGGGGNGILGADLDWLIVHMEERKGEWGDPVLWERRNVAG